MQTSAAADQERARAAADGVELRFLHVSPSMGPGGREMRAVELMGMLPRAVEHLVIAFDGDLRALERAEPGVRIRVLELPRPAGPFGRIRAMRESIRALGVDLLLTYNWGAIEWVAAGAFRGLCAVAHHEDGFGPEEAQGQLARRRLTRRLILRRAQAVIVPSRKLLAMARDTWKLSEPPLRYLPNGVALQRFVPGRDRSADPAPTFVCVGGVRKEKNQALAVEAFARTSCRPTARLRIVGDGPERAAVEELARTLGVRDRVDMVGNVGDSAPEYRRADVFLIPSRTEQMPLSLLEAMATALPVVGTDVGDVAMMVDPANRDWIVPPNDADALASAMDAAVADPNERARLGALNRTRVEREYDREVCYGAYCRLYLDLARRSALEDR